MKGVETRLSAPLAAMALLTVFVLVAVLFMIAARVDGDALRHEQALVQRGIDSKIADLQRIVSPQVLWDEAVEHLITGSTRTGRLTTSAPIWWGKAAST